ncbi:glycosyltransferase [Petroclostridium sp. X23]|uniref:glycosyltransferase n=1 Tax=Petroclostridium sp. X23 TaxID=3045146 RepID=UPI0024AE23E9|nr:glycosyltransferase [Petroclostridium sp. X23]WHH58248.1 glycosyltransferase [Petroclostridium sp. X23]
MRMKYKVLIGSPVRQVPDILKEFLKSLDELEKDNIHVDYFFIDDNDNDLSKKVLKDFSSTTLSLRILSSKDKRKVIIEQGDTCNKYICTEKTHQWNENLIWKVAVYKNRIIDYGKKKFYDYIFLVDSDLVLHPKTLKSLISAKKDIISEIFWTKWQPDSAELPQVWLYDQYSLIPQGRGEKLTQEESSIRVNGFLQKLKKPGIYEVGGLGACTLISKKAIQKGVSFQEIHNVSFWGEDRHFCIRAAALGFELFVDTNYPAYHIYRLSDLDGIERYKKGQQEENTPQSGSPSEPGQVSAIRAVSQTDISNTIKDFIQKYFSCDCRIVTGFEGHRFFTQKYIGKLMQKQDADVSCLIKNRIRCAAFPLSIDVDVEKAAEGTVKATADFSIKYIEEQGEKEKSFSCDLILKESNRSIWQIDFISLKNATGAGLLGLSLADLLENRERTNKSLNNKVTLAMLVRNEAGKYLHKVLSHAVKYVDNIVILDDASEDNTVEVCRQILKDIPSHVVSNKRSNFSNEISLRKQLWDMTVSTNPDWILCLDADEIFEDSIIDFIHQLIDQPTFDYYSFRLYDFWDDLHYREDSYWQAHKYYRTFLVRYQPNFNYTWHETPQHCGRFPNNINMLEGCQCNIRLKHYGWATEALRREKYKRYMELDPEGKYGNMNQYRTILDPNPNLIKWE